MQETRIVGIRHRVKKTAEGEARPTQVAILTDGKVRTLNLEDERAELNFVLGKFPTKFRDVVPQEDLKPFAPHHIKWRQLEAGEETETFAESHRLKQGKKQLVAHQVPAEYEGLGSGDSVAMSLGGSGDNLAYALSRQADKVQAEIWRIPPFHLKEERTGTDKDKDAALMASLLCDKPELFRPVTPRDRKQLLLRIRYRNFEEAAKARIATEQRLYQRLTGEIFTNPDGLYPEGSLEDAFKAAKANDKLLIQQRAEEAARERNMLAALQDLDVFKVIGEIEGLGTRIAGRLMAAALVNLGRFVVKPDHAEINRLRREATEWAELANIEAEGIARKANQARREHYFSVLQAKTAQGKTEGQAALQHAVACLDQIRNLKRKAEAKSCNKFKAYCGVHVFSGGKYGKVREDLQFPQRCNTHPTKEGHPANWAGIARQALYLVVTQFNMRPQSEWGQRLLSLKANQRKLHPEQVKTMALKKDGTPKLNKKGKPIVVTLYTDGHIHNRALWRTATRFAEWLFHELMKFENGAQQPSEVEEVAA